MGPLPLPTGATPTLPTPTAPTPTLTPTAAATAVSATTAAGNLPHPYVHIRGHHLRAGCLGLGEWSGKQQQLEDLSKSKKTLNGLSTRLKVCVLSFRGSL